MVRCLLYTMVGLIVSIGLFQTNVQAQSVHNHATCGVGLEEDQAIKTRMLNNRRNRVQLLSELESSRNSNNIVYVPVQFHIVNKSDGTGGGTVKDVLGNLCRINNDYAPIGVQFYLYDAIRFINQDLLYNNNQSSSMATYFMGMYRQEGAVNVFVGNKISNGSLGKGTVLGYYTSGIDVVYAIRSSVNANATTLTHEMGHFLGLPHTFFGWEGSFYGDVMANTTGRTPRGTLAGVPIENITRPSLKTGEDNCQLAADAFCDTDANYLFGFYRSTYNIGPNNCEFAGTAIDPNGYMFRPDMIAEVPERFMLVDGDEDVEEVWLTNLSSKDQIYRKTKIVTSISYEFNGTTTEMWSDTLGDSDTTEVFCPTNKSRNIISFSAGATDKGYITTAGHTISTTFTAPNASGLTFEAAQARYTITSQTGDHRTDIDSLRVTNTGTTLIVSGESIVITDVFTDDQGVQVSSASRTLTLPDSLDPGEAYTFTAPMLQHTANDIAGVKFSMGTYAPYRQKTGTTSNNVMSYYGDFCATDFSIEQSEAMKMDIASRGFQTMYDDPTDLPITQTVNINHPLHGGMSPAPLVQFRWDAVPNATMYHIKICEVNILNVCMLNGESHDFIARGNDAWITLTPNKRYRWTIMPMNSVSFCDRAKLESTPAVFKVNNWTIGVDKVEGEATTTRVYPNPIGKNQQVMLEINAAQDGEANITIINSIGQNVMPAQTLNLVQGANVERLSITNLSAGLYIVNIETNGKITSHKLVIKD